MITTRMVDYDIQDKIKVMIDSQHSPYGFLNRDWLKSKYTSVYFRVTHRYITGLKRRTLEIANIEIVESKRGCGIFTSLIDFLSSYNGYTLFIENVHEPKLGDWLDRNGFEVWIAPGDCGCVRSYYKIVE